MSLFKTLKNLLPGYGETSTLNKYFQDAYQLEYKNLELLKLLIPTIKYAFIADILTEIEKDQIQNCKQIEIEMASNQIEKPALLPRNEDDSATLYQTRYKLMNQLLENTKTLSSLYLHISHGDTIAKSEHALKLYHEKEKHLLLLQDVVIRLN